MGNEVAIVASEPRMDTLEAGRMQIPGKDK